jgi:cytochrome c556
MNKTRVVILALLIVGGLTFAGYRFHNRFVTASVPNTLAANPQAREALRQFMESKVHHEYTYLSFTIWHDKPLTPEKMDSIAMSSSRVIDLSKELTGYAAVYKDQGWSSEDVQFFEEKRLQLARVAEELNHAAKNHNSTEVINFFMHMDNTCQSCHKRFRPDLQWI